MLFHDALVQDDVDRLPTAVVFTPALTAGLPHDWAVGGRSFTHYGVQMQIGTNVARVEDATHHGEGCGSAQQRLKYFFDRECTASE